MIVQGEGKRKPRRMTCSGFTDYLYKVMGWDTSCRYKVLGYRIEFDGEAMYVFDLGVPKTFHEKPKKGEERPDGETVDTRKGFFPDDIANSFGVPYEEHKKAQEVNVEDGMVTIGILTGGKREQQGSGEQSEEKQTGQKQSGEKRSGEKYSGAQDKTRPQVWDESEMTIRQYTPFLE